MNFNYQSRRAVVLILLGFSLFQLVAATISVLLWVLMGDWRPFTPFIAGIASVLTVLIIHSIWNHKR